ncbi:hypothetical protein CLOSTMETH_00944 [[Clostridium] methylpentosum DSM 5476]|uniref:Uncharacterized protein n=1 Tax=[Clostridium] methylpentosum DSM 5476 TaxID=537013 RepID=C0EAT0_9FIRM|nr:hypothetical protein CLOSTMETH_00944 [[Clostridium] methylpentosum DSM 5476]
MLTFLFCIETAFLNLKPTQLLPPIAPRIQIIAYFFDHQFNWWFFLAYSATKNKGRTKWYALCYLVEMNQGRF